MESEIRSNTFYKVPLLIFLTALCLNLPKSSAQQENQSNRDLIVITDMEPDDRIALELIAARLHNRLQFIGTTVKNSHRKAALVRNQLAGSQLANIPVIVGSGGQAHDYTDIASSRAARMYHQEGQGILTERELSRLERLDARRGSQALNVALTKSLQQALKSNLPLEIVLLAPPTDLVSVLESKPELKRAIKHIHIMGGWAEVKKPSTDIVEKRTTYNINMDERASAELMKMTDLPMTLYSSHIIKPNFSGGSISQENYPKIINLIENSQTPGLQIFRKAGYSWDTHLIEMIPPLKDVIGHNVGRQFTPADPLVIIGLLNPKLITSSETVDINIVLGDLDPNRGFLVDVSTNVNSKINLVTGIDTVLFGVEMVNTLETIERQTSLRRSVVNRAGSISCKKLFSSI